LTLSWFRKPTSMRTGVAPTPPAKIVWSEHWRLPLLTCMFLHIPLSGAMGFLAARGLLSLCAHLCWCMGGKGGCVLGNPCMRVMDDVWLFP
jgi:hypothetical protein